MPNHGGRAELAPYPDWTARYLVHREPRQRRFVLALGVEAGVEGAREAYDVVHPIVAERPYVGGVPDLALRAGWALAE